MAVRIEATNRYPDPIATEDRIVSRIKVNYAPFTLVSLEQVKIPGPRIGRSHEFDRMGVANARNPTVISRPRIFCFSEPFRLHSADHADVPQMLLYRVQDFPKHPGYLDHRIRSPERKRRNGYHPSLEHLLIPAKIEKYEIFGNPHVPRPNHLTVTISPVVNGSLNLHDRVIQRSLALRWLSTEHYGSDHIDLGSGVRFLAP